MKLVVVESPTKAKTLEKYLDKNYTILASMGHVRDLPSKEGSIDTDNHFKMHYVITPRAEKTVDKICKEAKRAEQVILASDPDREGESIAWHIQELIVESGAKKRDQIKRAAFSEVTPVAVKAAVSNPRDIDFCLVDAQKARRAVDYLVGYNLSPVLWHKCSPAKSAGRVQSVALELITEREMEIKAFIPKEYWTLDLVLPFEQSKLNARVVSFDGNKFSTDFPSKGDIAEEIKNAIFESKKCKVVAITSKEFKQNPPPPFITSTMQQEALRKLGFSSSKTMMLAQKLYEGIDTGSETIGLITYMRTDGTYISGDAMEAIRKTIKSQFGMEFLPEKGVQHKTKVKNAQEAHEAVRVTRPEITPEKAKAFLETDMLKLYSLIWKRTIACQMLPAKKSTDAIKFDVLNVPAEAVISATKTIFDGFLRVYNDKNLVDSSDELESDLPNIKEGQIFNIEDVLKNQHFTLPPPRYNEASLIKKMEELGVGRPSTYATIISVIQDRNYVYIDKKQFYTTPIGMFVAAFLKSFFPKYVEYSFTAKMEEELDDITAGGLSSETFLQKFWSPFIESIKENEKIDMAVIGTAVEDFLAAYIFGDSGRESRVCKVCGLGQMNLRTGKFGPYVRCSRYPDCDNTISLDKLLNAEKVEGGGGVSIESEGVKITLKSGPYGKYIEIINGDVKKNVSIPKDIKEVSEEVIKQLASLPLEIGIDPLTKKPISVNVGRYGPYVGSNGKFASIKSAMMFTITPDEAMSLIKKQEEKASAKGENPKNKTTSRNKKGVFSKKNKS